jgi:hypothetical protein
MTAEDKYNNVTDKSLVYHFSHVIPDPGEQGQQFSYLCDECGFVPCACKYIVETWVSWTIGFSIIKGKYKIAKRQ